MVTRRLGEQDITMTTLYVLFTVGDLDTSTLKDQIIRMLNPQGENLDSLYNRADTKITQIIRNMISHRTNSTNIIARGLVNYNEINGILSITSNGIRYLDNFMTQKLVNELQ